MTLAITQGWTGRKRLIQFAQFMVGGGLYFWSGYLIFAICYSGFHWQWWQAKLLADIIGWTLNYLVQRYWAFANPMLKTTEGRNRTRYIVLSVGNIILDYLIVGGLLAVGVTPYIGMFVAAGFFTAWNYIWYRWWVFTESS